MFRSQVKRYSWTYLSYYHWGEVVVVVVVDADVTIVIILIFVDDYDVVACIVTVVSAVV